MRPLRYSINVTLDGCCDHRAIPADEEFLTIIRPIDALRDLLAADPYSGFRLQRGAKRVVTFLRHTPGAKMKLPIEVDGARILTVRGREVFTAHVQSSKGAVFMTLIEKTFGKEATTRTWDSIAKITR
jgi:hypothetical protein